jgi:hypothetical protein
VSDEPSYVNADWKECIEAVDEWANFVWGVLEDWSIGVEIGSRQYNTLRQLSLSASDLVHRVAGLDPMPIIDTTILISTRDRSPTHLPIPEMGPVPLDRILFAYQRANSLRALCYHRGLADGKMPPLKGKGGRPRLREVANRRRRVAELHSTGLKPGEIAARLKIPVSIVYADVRRLRQAAE